MIIAKILFSLATLVFLYLIYYLIKGRRDRNHPTPDDLLYDLNFKIEYAMIDSHSEKYLNDMIKEYWNRSDMDKEKLDVLNRKFHDRFEILHIKDTQ